MQIKLKKIDIKLTGLLFLTYITLVLNYKHVISEFFGYLGYTTTFYTIEKMIISSSTTFILIILSIFFKNDFYKMVYNTCLIMYYFGQSVFYMYNNSQYILVVYMMTPLIVLFFWDKIDDNRVFKRHPLNLSDNRKRFIFITFIVILIIPFFKYINILNVKNLLLIDVYETRMQLRQYDRGLLGYLFSPLSRVLLPFTFIYSIINRKRKITIMSVIGIIMLYLLNGAVKSVFFGFFSAIFFMKGNYKDKEKNFLKAIFAFNILGLLGYRVFKITIINDYMRRLFFVPPKLFEIYYYTFAENPTLFLHSKMSKMLGINTSEGSLSLFVGEQIIGKKGLNANVGIFAEGFVSFGTVGVIIASIVFVLIIFILKKSNYNSAYYGIVFPYIYIINTSFIETLMITHGLLFFIIFSYLLVPKENQANYIR